MEPRSPYAVPLTTLDSVRVPVNEQVEEQDVDGGREYVAPEDLDRARLLGITSAGRVRLR